MAARINRTPPIDATGNYELNLPWKDGKDYSKTTIYRCESIRGFPQLDRDNIDVFINFYKPHGIVEAFYRQDAEANINIITLISEDGSERIDVPSSYIKKFPLDLNVPYSRVLLTFDLGLLPDSLAIEQVAEEMGILASYKLGAMGISDDGAPGLVMGVDITAHKVPITGFVSKQSSVVLETARSAGIALTDSVLDNSTSAAAQEKIVDLEERVEGLQEALVNNANSSNV